MSDDECVSLIEAEYDQQNSPVDEIGKKQVWENVLAEINSNDKMLKPNTIAVRKWLPLAAVALLVLSVIPLYYLIQPDNSVTRMKGIAEIPVVRLSVYEIDVSGQLSTSTGVHELGSTIVFKYDAPRTVALALAMSRDGLQPEIRFINNAALPGNRVLLQKNDKTYGYMLEPLDKKIRFCVIAAENEAALKARLSVINQEWVNLAAESCITIYVKDK